MTINQVNVQQSYKIIWSSEKLSGCICCHCQELYLSDSVSVYVPRIMESVYSSIALVDKRYGSWTGRVNFSNGVAAADAISLFDKEQFPRVRLHQSSESPDVLKFVSSNLFDGKTCFAHLQKWQRIYCSGVILPTVRY